MQRTPCTYCSLPLATDEDDATLEHRTKALGKVSTDIELFGEPLCWHSFTSEHPNDGQLIETVKFWRARAEKTAAFHQTVVDQYAALAVAVNHAVLRLDAAPRGDTPTFVATSLRNMLTALQQGMRAPNAAATSALEDLQQTEAKLKAAFDEFRAAALKAGKVMP